MPVTTMPAKGKAEEAEEPKKKGKLKFLLIAVVVVVALLGAGWFLLMKPKGDGEPPAPKPGEVLALDPIQVNLAGGHYLRVGLALQLTADAKEAEGSKALDAAIELFSGKTIDKLALPEEREKLKHHLLDDLVEAYEGEVMGVYFTDFVTQ